MATDNVELGEGIGMSMPDRQIVEKDKPVKTDADNRHPKQNRKLFRESRRNRNDRSIVQADNTWRSPRQGTERAVGILSLTQEISFPNYQSMLQSMLKNSGLHTVPYGSLSELKRNDAATEIFALLIHTDSGLDRWVPELAQLHQLAPHIRQVVMVDQMEAVKGPLSEMANEGILFDYHTLPLDETRLSQQLGHLRGVAELETAANTNSAVRTESEPQMVGSSETLLDVFNMIRKYAAVDAPVLITGESGTGKELAAKAIHERSAYADGPFIAINCGALPPTLIESELFGHEKGAFTGAVNRKQGRLELAEGGTLFLDEIGDLPGDMQAHLLRFLQEGTLERLGGTKKISVSTRIISATNVDLKEAIAKGKFREDLFYRLNVLPLQLPALRDRGSDIELLAEFFLNKFSAKYGKSGLYFSRSALSVIRHYGWPGNIRELISAVRRGIVMSRSRIIHPVDMGIGDQVEKETRGVPLLSEARDKLECRLILQALDINQNNVKQAASELGISRVAFYRLLKKHNVMRNIENGGVKG